MKDETKEYMNACEYDPMGKIAATTILVKRIGQRLRRELKGQENAIREVEEGIFSSFVLQGKSAHGPKLCLTLVGPSGVGKTSLAKILAEELGLPYKKFSMAAFADEETQLTLTGFDSTFKDAKEGKLTGEVMKNPHAVILLDDLGKEHKNIDNALLQLFSEGEMYDLFHAKNVSFKNAIVILTTNLGESLYKSVHKHNYASLPKKKIVDALLSEKKPNGNSPAINPSLVQLLAKFPIIAFNKISDKDLCDIVEARVEALEEKYLRAYPKLSIECDKREIAKLTLYGGGSRVNARSAATVTEKFFTEHIYGAIRTLAAENKNIFELKNLYFQLNLDKLPPELLEWSNGKNDLKIGVLCDKKNREQFTTKNASRYSFIEDVDSFDSIDYDCVFVELFDEDKAERNKLLERLFEEQRIPVYAFSIEKRLDEALINEYKARGVFDVFNGTKSDFLAWLDKTFDCICISGALRYLARANKILSYNVRYVVEQKDGALSCRILFDDYLLRVNVSAQDEDKVLLGVEIPDKRFNDVVGLADTVRELKGVIDCLKNHRAHIRAGKALPKGILLYGDPGTGKTLSAQALAGEAQLPFVSKSAAELLSRYAGDGEKRLKEYFELARNYAPCILHFDEVDAIARPRGRGEKTAAEGILNVFLTEMDKIAEDKRNPVFVVCSTNFTIDSRASNGLDKAFVRRFDRKIEVRLPDTKGRKAVLLHYLQKNGIHLAEEKLSVFAERTYGKSPADIAKLVEYAVRNAHGGEVTEKSLDEALELTEYGEKKSWNKSVVEQISYHEAGHAVVAWAMGKTPAYVTNVSRGTHGGYVLSSGDEEKFAMTKKDLLDKICVCFGGRAAEMLFYAENGLTTGASADVQYARSLARAIINDYAMDEELFIGLDEMQAEESKRIYDQKINKILCGQSVRAVEMINRYRLAVEALAKRLAEVNSLTKKELEALLLQFQNTKRKGEENGTKLEKESERLR